MTFYVGIPPGTHKHPHFQAFPTYNPEPPMKKLLSLIATAFALTMTLTPAAHAADTCAAQSAEKKLAGAAKSAFEKKCIADASGDKKVAEAKPAAKTEASKK